jgi:molybdopterin-guanine dinucleotide biosynthesis protein A
MRVHELEQVAAAILAGGEATRLGGANKAALRVGGARIIDRQLALLREVADPVFIVSRDAGRFADLDIAVVPDLVPGLGPLGGIETALASSPHSRTLIVACDLPFLSRALLRRLVQPSDADLVIPRSTRGHEPLCATWGAACLGPVRRRIEAGHRKAALLVQDVRVEELTPEFLASCDPHGRLFVNVNTPHEHERAEALSQLDADRHGSTRTGPPRRAP